MEPINQSGISGTKCDQPYRFTAKSTSRNLIICVPCKILKRNRREKCWIIHRKPYKARLYLKGRFTHTGSVQYDSDVPFSFYLFGCAVSPAALPALSFLLQLLYGFSCQLQIYFLFLLPWDRTELGCLFVMSQDNGNHPPDQRLEIQDRKLQKEALKQKEGTWTKVAGGFVQGPVDGSWLKN